MSGGKWLCGAVTCLCIVAVWIVAPLGEGTPSVDFRSDGDLISGWYWLRDASLAQQAWWTFEGIQVGTEDIVLDITCLATDAVDGHRGVSATFRMGYGFPGSGAMGGAYVVEDVTLPNVSSPTDPVGYTCRGTVRVPLSTPGVASGTLTVFVERVSPSGPHVAFRKDSVLLPTVGLADQSVGSAVVEVSCERAVDGLLGLTSGVEVPEYLTHEGAVKRGGEFDAGAYFDVLDRLSMEPGYALDYVYRFEGIGGRPVLYARPTSQAPFAAYEDLVAVQGEPQDAYLDHVKVDSTPGHPEGYFQFVLLHMLGEQFYLYWHAFYHDTVVVCTSDAIEEVLLALDGGFGAAIPEADKKHARAINPKPWVSVGGDFVRVRVVTFSKWGGFVERTYTVTHSFPHRIVDVQSTSLVGYDCGVMF